MTVNVRNLIRGEELPLELRSGYESADNTDCSWIWVAEHEGEKTAILVTAPAHVAVLFIRLASVPGSNPNDVRALLVYACAQMKLRGYLGYFTYLNPETEIEQALMKIFLSTGGVKMPDLHVLCAGRV